MAVGNDPDAMLKKAQDKVEQAAKAGAKIICLPELFKTRYFPQHIGVDASAFAETIPGESTADFFRDCPAHQMSLSSSRSMKRHLMDRFYNTAVVIDADGTLHAPYHKVHIPQDPGFFEKGYFYPGEGYRVFDTRHGRIAVLICFDQWFPEAARCVALDGAEIIFYPTAIGHPGGDEPAEGNWQEAWELIQRSHAVANSVHIAAVNRAGQEENCRFFGGSFVCDAFGKIIAKAGDGEETLIASLDLSMNSTVQESWGFFRNRRPETYGRIGVPFRGRAVHFPPCVKRIHPRNRGIPHAGRMGAP
ncbi:MAG: hypothetical protein MZU91_08910 [Desulfosudis oleivorans]|nr:hypothetical protein [Desulfosudis oleivorans]